MKSFHGKPKNWNVVTMLKMLYLTVSFPPHPGWGEQEQFQLQHQGRQYITISHSDMDFGGGNENLSALVLIEINGILLKYFMQKSPMVTFMKSRSGKSDILIKL